MTTLSISTWITFSPPILKISSALTIFSQKTLSPSFPVLPFPTHLKKSVSKPFLINLYFNSLCSQHFYIHSCLIYAEWIIRRPKRSCLNGVKWLEYFNDSVCFSPFINRRSCDGGYVEYDEYDKHIHKTGQHACKAVAQNVNAFFNKFFPVADKAVSKIQHACTAEHKAYVIVYQYSIEKWKNIQRRWFV